MAAAVSEEHWSFEVSTDDGKTWRGSHFVPTKPENVVRWIFDFISNDHGRLTYGTTDGTVVIRDKVIRSTLYRWKRLEP
jgi:hypothetical protein